MRKLNSATVYFVFVMAIMCLIWSQGLLGQTSCSTNSPCVQVTITNPNTLPSSAVLWSCQGSTCTLAALNTVIAAQTPTVLCPTNVQSVWHCTSFSQSKTPQAFNDPEPYGALMNYASQGTSGGGVSAASPIITFQVPSAPAQPTSIGSVPTVVTTGTTGPQ